MISTPKHWLPNFQRLAPPSFALPRWPRGVLPRPEEGGVNLLQPELPVWPLPLASPPCPLCFQAGKVASMHPFPNTPPCAPIPLRESKPRRRTS